jgi:hypothetical protein
MTRPPPKLPRPIAPSKVVAQRVNELRRERRWSLPELADRCAQAGAHDLTRDVLANLMTLVGDRRRKTRQRRQNVSIEEVFVLAQVFGVAPIDLMIPKDKDAFLQLTPNEYRTAHAARRWVTGVENIVEEVRHYYDRLDKLGLGVERRKG